MINKLYDNCFTTELSTKVLEVREDNGLFWHACKDTIFYKEGGGMASDIGMIDEHMVLDLKYEEGHMWHLLDTRLEGTVFMSVNLHERFRKCQIHTAQHLISAVLGNVYKVETLAHHVGDEENDIEFSSVDDMYNEHEELNLGDIMSDAYVYAVENSEYYDGDPVDVAVVPSGTVRDTYTKGDVTVEPVYNSFSLGIGKDGLAGYPLISAYLTGKELKLVAEIDASVSDFMTIARLYCSGLNFTYNPHRMILNKVTDCYLMEAQGEGNREEIEDDKLYHVVTDLYTGQMLGAVMDTSYGLLSITPKDKDGNPIENLEDQAIMEGNQELKAWAAIARYMESFDDTDGDGIANVSEYYNEKHDRKVVEDSWNIIDLVKHPNKFLAIIAGIFVLVIVLIILLILLVKKIVRKIKTN